MINTFFSKIKFIFFYLSSFFLCKESNDETQTKCKEKRVFQIRTCVPPY